MLKESIQTSSYSLPIEIPNLQFFHSNLPFLLENGEILPEIQIAYHTYGTLNTARDNVIWVCHALTANSNVADWWDGVFGKGKVLDPDKYFIICANMLGSCYGTTCPRSINPQTGKAYGIDFPLYTIRDVAKGHELLRKHLNIEHIALCIGGSCGGHQVLEFAFLNPNRIQKMVLLATSARESPWSIAIHESQRLAIEADATWNANYDSAGENGLRAARAIGLLTYRTIGAFRDGQKRDGKAVDDFRASSYVRYQGEKLVRRFYAQSYWYLTKALDSHDVGRDRGGITKALQALQIPTLVFSIQSDMLIPPAEQRKLAKALPNSKFVGIASDYGHDGFLIEHEAISAAVLGFWEA